MDNENVSVSIGKQRTMCTGDDTRNRCGCDEYLKSKCWYRELDELVMVR